MTASLVLLAGILLAAGLVCLAVGALPAVPRLAAALERVGSDGAPRVLAAELGPVRKPSERLGALLYRIYPISLSERQRRALQLQDKPIAEFYADKAVMIIIGALLDRKSTRLNSSHLVISYAGFCLKKKKNRQSTTDE